MSDIDVAAADHVLESTEQLRPRLDLTRAGPWEPETTSFHEWKQMLS